MCDSHSTALECSFCNHVYHNTSECIGQLGERNIASAESVADGAHWACPACWMETSAAARRAVLGGEPNAGKKRQRRQRAFQGGAGQS